MNISPCPFCGGCCSVIDGDVYCNGCPYRFAISDIAAHNDPCARLEKVKELEGQHSLDVVLTFSLREHNAALTAEVERLKETVLRLESLSGNSELYPALVISMKTVETLQDENAALTAEVERLKKWHNPPNPFDSETCGNCVYHYSTIEESGCSINEGDATIDDVKPSTDCINATGDKGE